MRGVRFFWWFAICCMGCGEPDHGLILGQYLEQQLGISQEEWPKAIFVITEDGCPACNRAFADLMRPRTTAPQCLFIVRAEGLVVNMNGFLQETDQIRFDNGSFKDLDLLKGSGMILLNEGQVDKVIDLDAAEIEAQLENMADLLDLLEQVPK